MTPLPRSLSPQENRRRTRWIAGGALAVALCVGAGCARRPALPSPSLLAEENCPTLPGRAEPGTSLTFALTEPVDAANAPLPDNAAEAIVFGNLYETLVAVDCRGQVVPALAEAWRMSEDGREWTFTLRRDARFWDGTRVRAADVKSAWSLERRRLRLSGRLGWMWKEIRPRFVRIVDDRRLAIVLLRAREDLPHLLSQPAFAVTRRIPGERWPLGTLSMRVAEGAPFDGEITLVPVTSGWGPLRSPARITFRILPGRDPRDLLAEGADAVLTRDRAACEYLARRENEYAATALPWDRLYLLLLPEDASAAAPIHAARANLARDAVASDAIPWDSVFLDCLELPCPQHEIELQAPTGKAYRGRLIYPQADRDARDLAARIAFLLAANGRGPAPAIEGLPRNEFREALARGDGDGIVLPVARRFATDCLQAHELLTAAPWLLDREALEASRPAKRAAVVLEEPVRAGRITPLVATRAHLVTRAGLSGVRFDYDGVPGLGRAGWSVEGSLP